MDFFHQDSWQKFTWIELTGFDREKEDFGVEDFLHRTGFVPTGVSFLLYWVGFVFSHDGLDVEKPLSIAEDSYGAHPYAPERPRQNWTNFEFKGLIDELHKHGIKVYMSYFNMLSYSDDDDNTVIHPAFEGWHDKIMVENREGKPCGGINVLRRMINGEYFEDKLIEKTVSAMNDYGFDGIQIADGISSPRVTLEQGCFSKDMLEQFADATGIVAPEGGNAGKWIWENKRWEWINFNTDRWEIFYKKFIGAVKDAGKEAVFNSAWTRDPFEAMYRYGVDYRKVAKTGVDGCMVEDTSAGLAILSEEDNLYLMTDAQRKRVHYEFLSVLMMNRAAMPDVKITPLAGVHDTMEQWGVFEHMPTAMTRNVMNNLETFIINKDGLKPITDGPFFCLSDGLSKTDWDFIKKQWEIGAIEKATGVSGATVIWSDARVDHELKAFIKNRNTPTHRLVSELLYAGANLYSIARIEDIDSVNGPILVTNPGLLPEYELKKVLSFKNGSVFLIGDGAKRDGFEEAVFEENSFGSICITVNGMISEKKSIKNEKSYDFDPVTGLEKVEAIWTHPLCFQPVTGEFFLKAADVINEMTNAPTTNKEIVSEDGSIKRPCKCIMTFTGEKTARVLLTNDDYFYNLPKVDLKRKIKAMKCLTKYDG
ncbi:MAG: hypothetical protein IJD86_11830, partial [Clostridia bacterium]|nr:hypothetical protein [Clostridia bacterium]